MPRYSGAFQRKLNHSNDESEDWMREWSPAHLEACNNTARAASFDERVMTTVLDSRKLSHPEKPTRLQASSFVPEPGVQALVMRNTSSVKALAQGRPRVHAMMKYSCCQVDGSLSLGNKSQQRGDGSACG